MSEMCVPSVCNFKVSDSVHFVLGGGGTDDAYDLHKWVLDLCTEK